MTPEVRFWKKVDRNGPAPTVPGVKGNCWQWIAGASPKGYGRFYISGRLVNAHRYAYELAMGSVPNGLVVDHLCRNRACVNIEHLEAITNRENVMRGEGPTANNARKSHCKRGHEFTPENMWVFKNGERYCRRCEKIRRAAASRKEAEGE